MLWSVKTLTIQMKMKGRLDSIADSVFVKIG